MMKNTFLGGCEDIQCVEREEHQGCREFVAQEPKLAPKLANTSLRAAKKSCSGITHMNCVVLVKLGDVLDLAHQDHHGRCAAKEAILGAEVILPRRDK